MQWFLMQLLPPRDRFAETVTDAEKIVLGQHFEYMKKLTAEGIAYLVGRTEDATIGIALVRAAGQEEAQKLLDADPGIQKGIFSGSIRAYRLALYQPFPSE